MNTPYSRIPWRTIAFAVPLLTAHAGFAQDAEDEEVIELDPFVVAEDENMGYMATHTLAGTRIRTELSDVGSAISVVTEEFLQDTGATDNESLLVYTTNTEVGGPQGNFANVDSYSTRPDEGGSFANPSQQTRVRGLADADNTRDYFLSDIPWDGFNVERVDMQRGPNAILFGLGSPAGIINKTISPAGFFDGGDFSFRIGSFGSSRVEGDFNLQAIDDELAVRVAAVTDKSKFRQEPAFEDSDRFYTALRYDPEFLRGDGMRTTLRVNYETGEIDSNRPRQLPPVDLVSPFFLPVFGPNGRYAPRGGVDGQVFGVYEMQNNLVPGNGQGQNRVTYDDGAPNPDFLPALGSFSSVFGGPVWFFNADQQNQYSIYQSEFDHIFDIDEDGNQGNGNIEGTGYQRLIGLANYAQYVLNATQSQVPENLRANLPYAEYGQYKDFSLSDPSVFDFYNNLIDGPTKAEWSDWDAYNINLSQTFFDNRLGVELAYDKQEYSNGVRRLFTGGQVAINVDVNETLFDFNENPNAGRPFISGDTVFGNNSYASDREVLRATAFGELRASDYLGEGFVTRLLGRLLLTGLYVDDSVETEQRQWGGYATSQDYFGSYTGAEGYFSDDRRVNPVVYLGPSLIGRSSAAGLGLSPVQRDIQPMSGQMLWFNSRWDSPNVDPGAEWEDQFGTITTESENPANYVGPDLGPVTVLSARDGQRDFLTRGAQLAKQEVESVALVGQWYFWDEALVGVVGWREDEATSYAHQATADSLGLVNLDAPSYRLPDEASATVKDDSLSYSVALHLHRLPLGDKLPVEVSLYYNESENFRPIASRVDILGQPIGPPSGETTDKSILISTKDNRFSLKVTQYETSISDDSNQSLSGNASFIGLFEARGASWSNMFEFDLSTTGPGNPGGENTYSPVDENQTEEQAAAEEAASVAGWRQHQANIRAWSEANTGNPNAFYEAWQIDTESMVHRAPENNFAGNPQGLAFTQDVITEGYEYEFTANPTPNWRITINAAQTEPRRINVGGQLVREFVDIVTTDVTTTTAGDLRLWWGSAGSPRFRDHWLGSAFRGNYELLQLLEDSPAPEVREWRFNLVSNYSFDEGFLDGFNIGAGYRWQDDVIIGFPLIETGGTVTFDIDNPYKGPTEDAVDLWFGYERSLTDTIDWRIQVNIRNVGDGEELIPISTQPDGTPAYYRIAPHQEWFITNTFSF